MCRKESSAIVAHGMGLALLVLIPSTASSQTLPAVPTPSENPFSEEKRVLGKILFWDEQLSSDGSVACGTCHETRFAGGDSGSALHPGADGVLDTADDVFGSEGVVRREYNDEPIHDPVHGFGPQVTGRASPGFFGGALWAPEVFWDGRAGGVFIDPEDGVTVQIASGGGLENQAVGPILSSVEMAHDGRTWAEVREKLASVSPLAHAADLPADVATALAGGTRYPDLFARAFGDPAITATRIAFAIATYERTLVADQTPWDRFQAGDTTALTATQKAGWDFFETSACSQCHPPPLFTDNSFRSIGVRDPDEDPGRAGVTGASLDNGRFKVPTLRNVGSKSTFFHTGEKSTLAQVITFYAPGNQGTTENVDALMPAGVPPPLIDPLIDFLSHGLLDPRVAAGTPPFDQPTLTAAGALPVPEPASGVLFGSSSLVLSLRARRRARLAGRCGYVPQKVT